MHDVEFEHFHATPEQAESLGKAIWELENVELKTIGIDIGSSTSHFMISRVHLQRIATGLSSRFIVVNREELWKSPVFLTPYLTDYTVDAAALGRFIHDGYAKAGIAADTIDTGAVILTGEALKRHNSRAIADLFAGSSGRFVCATAGHHLECALAAKGSGAASLSRQHKKTVLNIDIGGGTTKFALIQNGEILSTAAVAVGGRLLVWDAQRRLVRLEEPANIIGRHLGIDLLLDYVLLDPERNALADAMSDIVLALARQERPTGIAAELLVTEPLAMKPKADVVTFSGGVAEFLFGRESRDFNDLGPVLAHSLRHGLTHLAGDPAIWDPGEGIRATVVGASQFTVQVSGNTIFITSPDDLPIANVPVLSCRFELAAEQIDPSGIRSVIEDSFVRHDRRDGDQVVALAFRWTGSPSHARLKAVAEGIVQAMPRSCSRGGCVILLVDGDVGMSLGRLLRSEFIRGGRVISIDGLQLGDLDYVDIGSLISSTNVVPVVIKSLLFPYGTN